MNLESKRPTIAVVEDEEAIRELLISFLSDEGYHVEFACDGLEGQQLIKATNPALVLLNLQLPKLSGEQILAALRSDSRLQDIPVIVLSARPIVSGLVLREAQAVLSKPFDVMQLLDLIKTWAPLA
jgi:DNA-binding response OmpR family regulator